jgi:hypothetical protein
MLMPSTLIPYYACAASEGTQDRYQRMVSRRHITAPGQRAVRRQRRGINAHQRYREEEQLRAASKARNFVKGRARSNGSDGTSTKGCKQIKCEWKKAVAHAKEEMGIRKQDETKCHSTHLAPDSREPVFFALLAPKGGKYSDVTVPTPYRPTGAQVQQGPVLMIL